MMRHIAFVSGLLILTSHSLAQDVAESDRRVASRADTPPRKVLVGTAIFGPYGDYPGLDPRLNELAGLVDSMASEAQRKYGRGLDLAILTESAITTTRGTASERAQPLSGRIEEALAEIAREHATYLVASFDLRESGPREGICSNAAVLFDRSGAVAGIYRKCHPVAVLNDELEGGITPGSELPVFDCDFGKLGIQICFDIQYEDGWETLGRKGAEIVAWPTASPATVLPAARAARNRYYLVSSTWREDATIFEPTGMVAAQIEGDHGVLVHEIDLSFALIGWSSPLKDGAAFREKYGDRVGFHYSRREDLGIFWSNNAEMTIGTMMRELGLEEVDPQVRRNLRLHDRQGEASR